MKHGGGGGSGVGVRKHMEVLSFHVSFAKFLKMIQSPIELHSRSNISTLPSSSLLRRGERKPLPPNFLSISLAATITVISGHTKNTEKHRKTKGVYGKTRKPLRWRARLVSSSGGGSDIATPTSFPGPFPFLLLGRRENGKWSWERG